MKKALLITGFILLIPIVAVGAIIGMPATRAGEMQQTRAEYRLDDADSTTVDLQMQAGDLIVSGGADNLVDAAFEFNVASWEPTLTYNNVANLGQLTITQPKQQWRRIQNGTNRWNIQLTDAIPLRVNATNGAGTMTLDFAGLNIQSVQVNVGAGDVTLDMREGWAHDVDVTVDAGVGDITLTVPDTMSVEATVEGGIGSIGTSGFVKRGNTYISEFSNVAATLRIAIHAGMGDVNLRVATR